MGSPSCASTGLGVLAERAASVGSAAAVEGAAFAFFFLPFPFLAAASFSAASSPSSSAAIASAAAAACVAEEAALASASTACRLACCRSSCAISVHAVRFPRSAHMSAVLPLVSCSEASDLASSSTRTIVVWPLVAAHVRAVSPKEFCRLTLAPRCSSIRTIDRPPQEAALISSVIPMSPSSAQCASTPPPPSSHAATACASPFPAAPNTSIGSPNSTTVAELNTDSAHTSTHTTRPIPELDCESHTGSISVPYGKYFEHAPWPTQTVRRAGQMLCTPPLPPYTQPEPLPMNTCLPEPPTATRATLR
eukprot:scaffold1206_cov76-Phaeocystis_antarctica.AAC.2